MRHLELVLIGLGSTAIVMTASAQLPEQMNRPITEWNATSSTEAGKLAASERENEEIEKAKKRLEQEKAEIEALLAEEKATSERLAKEKADLESANQIPEVKEVTETQPDPQKTELVAEQKDEPAAEVIKVEKKPAEVKETTPSKPLFGYKSHKPIPYLVMVSNNRIPKDVFANFLLQEFDMPHLLLPPNGPEPVADEPVFFIGGTGDNQAILQITAQQLSEFIAFLRPQNVIILGDTNYIHPAYRMAVPQNIKMIELSNSTWKVNAVSLDNLLDSDKMFPHLNKYLKEKAAAEKEAAKNAENL